MSDPETNPPDLPGDPPPFDAEPAARSEAELEMERLRSDLDAARRRVDELARAYQAVDRDREDFKSRLQRERDRLIDVERGDVAVVLLEAVDELDLCLRSTGVEDSPLAQGVRLIRENILKKVEQKGIERLQLVGHPYDPSLAEAADMEVTADPEADQTVISEIRAGYRMKDRVIRPARVKVARYVRPADA